MLTDTLVKGRQTTREVNVSGVLFFPFPRKKKKRLRVRIEVQFRVHDKNLRSFILNS